MTIPLRPVRLHCGRIVTEQCFNGMERHTPHLLQSVSKSAISGWPAYSWDAAARGPGGFS